MHYTPTLIQEEEKVFQKISRIEVIKPIVSRNFYLFKISFEENTIGNIWMNVSKHGDDIDAGLNFHVAVPRLSICSI